MPRNFLKKPDDADVRAYEEKLNYFLQAHRVTVEIKLLDQPTRIESYTNGTHDGTDYYWTEKIEINTPKIKFEVDNLFSEHESGRDTYFDLKYAWTDAAEIQDRLYQKLDKFKSLEVGNNDPYWKIWDLIEK